jgi:hypothetical protein
MAAYFAILFNSYRAPYTQREHRRPILAWAREIPIDGERPDVAARVNSYGAWLETSTPVPKLLLTFDPGTSMSPSVIDWCRAHIASLEVRHIGPGIHFVQEDHGPAIGAAIAAWRHKTRTKRESHRRRCGSSPAHRHRRRSSPKPLLDIEDTQLQGGMTAMIATLPNDGLVSTGIDQMLFPRSPRL